MKIIFCFPGAMFPGKAFVAWTELLYFCLKNGIQPVLSQQYSCNIYFARNLSLGGNVTHGRNQKPFNGKIDYDYIMWIDSDIVYTPGQFTALLDHQADIVSGLYLMEGGKAFATVKEWDEEFFRKNGYFQFLTKADFQDQKGLMEVAYTGMGFMLVKKGVFEAMEYPWFEPRKHEIGDFVDYSMEDVSFCLKAKEKGFKIMVDPSIIVGHVKSSVLI